MTEDKSCHFPYLPHTDHDREEMLKAIGVSSFDELVKLIPKEVRAQSLNLPRGMSELELSEHIASLAAKNKPASAQACFLGGGSYRRFVPAIVPSIISRSEFSTAYTPYQAEASQGTLQAIYEFQTAICLLTGMDVANASIYDGPTACAEAALMACRLKERHKIFISLALNNEYASVTTTYANAAHIDVGQLACPNGLTDTKSLGECAALIVQYPNFLGSIEDVKVLAEAAHKVDALLIVVSDPLSLGLLAPPGQFGADIVVGDAQQCGNFLSFGGPTAGYIACRQDFIRQLPGRLSGMTVDKEGKRAFTLALQTREQHIRRAKATSNICTNQALNALAMLVYLTAMGPHGLKQVGMLSMQRAHYLAKRLAAIPGVKMPLTAAFFNEFVINTPKPSRYVLEELLKNGIIGGLDLNVHKPSISDGILVAVTEMNSRAQLDHYADTLSRILLDEDNPKDIGKPNSVSLARSGKTSSPVK
ncbi:MAG: aminomethyl-transferring glycine dehydrogenase [Candidatus Melainabacteria bacterium]|nr:MAG: aminomethyl-transferring glycine dehydrogenase [Candidatus Melainabacteria bacterium]